MTTTVVVTTESNTAENDEEGCSFMQCMSDDKSIVNSETANE